MSARLSVLLFLLVFAMLLPVTRAVVLDFSTYGFQIDSLEAPMSHLPSKALVMYLPALHGWNPNVNVLIQPPTPMKDYMEGSRKQFQQMSWKVVAEKVNGDKDWAVEFTGPASSEGLNGMTLHWYQRDFFTPTKVYSVTATAPEADWPGLAEKLKQCVDSFKLK